MNSTFSPASLVGYAIAILTVVGTWLRERRKGDIDESALVLGKWKELVERHERALQAQQEEFKAFRTSALETERTLRVDLTDLRDRLRTAEGRIGELERENEGLKRTIAQNSQTTAWRLDNRPGVSLPEDTDMLGRLDRAGHNKGVR